MTARTARAQLPTWSLSLSSLDTERTFDGKFTVKHWWELYINSDQIRDKPQLFSQFVEDGSLVFDIGANRGGMTYVFRQLGARVIAVEPLHITHPNYVRAFQWMFQADRPTHGKAVSVDGRKFGVWTFDNDLDVILIPAAISPDDEVEIATPPTDLTWFISSCSADWRTKSAHKHLYNSAKVSKVPGIRLDDLIALFGMPSFIKIDVEGYNAEVMSTLSYPVRALNMEFHQDWLHSNVGAMRHLAAIGDYEYNYALGNRGGLQLDSWVSGADIVDHLRRTLTQSGDGSWGDIYARLRHSN